MMNIKCSLMYSCWLALVVSLQWVVSVSAGDLPTLSPTPTGTPTKTSKPTATSTPTPTQSLRCKDCSGVTGELMECSHPANHFPYPVGCGKGYLLTTMESASCQNVLGLPSGPSECNTDLVIPWRPETITKLFDYYLGDPCVSGVGGEWTLWRRNFFGCGDDCLSVSFWKTCDASYWNPSRKLIDDPKGHKKTCGCEVPTPTPLLTPTQTRTPTASSTPLK